ncbi:MAG TPA: prolyl oligopeptidase family serine peptidase, partial [Kofleriaceae bacterium]
GESLAFQRTDARAVDTRYLGDPRHPEQPPAAVKVPRSGKTNATVDLGIVSVRGGAPRWVTWDLARYPYLARVIWPDRGALTLIVVGREQNTLAVLAVDPATGATRPLLTETSPTWLNVAPDALTWLPDGSGFLWMTESHGAWDLEHHAADGKHVRQVLTPDVGLRGVVGLSRDGREVLVEAAGDPHEQHVWRVPLAGGEPVALTAPTAGGLHRAVSGHGTVVIASDARAGGHSVSALRDGGARVELPSVAERPAQPPTTKLETVIVVDHTVNAAITRPHAFDPKVRYPVVLRIASGPGRKSVLDALDTYLVDQCYADAGFIVVRADGRGTPDRDRDWERVIAGDVLTAPMTDQLAALKQLGAHHPELDLARVGAIGAGYGGYLAALGALIHPDQIAAAIAIAPITDWELLDSAYAERYMKTPAINPEGYRRTAASTYAEQLRRPLLLIPAVGDDRAPLAHTLALIEALSAAGKRAELATLPAVRDATIELARTRLELDFLRDKLGPPVRPAVMPAPRSEEEEEEEEERKRRSPPPAAR